MDSGELINKSSSPVTPKTIARDLRLLGVSEGDVLVVHSSLSSLGWVAGGAAAVVDALLDAVGPDGTISMPAHSGDWGDPAGWKNPPVPTKWWTEILAGRPAFDPYSTPLREMGKVAENLLVRRSTLRSNHPLYSHMANGRLADVIVRDHPLEDGFGERSPLGRLYELHAKVVLLGVGHSKNTSLHLAEARARWTGKEKVEYRSKVRISNGGEQVSWLADDLNSDDFDQLGDYLDGMDCVMKGVVGQTTTRIAPMQQIVDLAVPWFEENRGKYGCNL